MTQGMFRDVGKKNKKGNNILGNPFMLHRCYEVLGNEQKWKTRGKLDAATMAANATGDATISDDGDLVRKARREVSLLTWLLMQGGICLVERPLKI
jgi:hypothetical protein